VFGRAGRVVETQAKKGVLLLGSGFFTRPCVDYYVVGDPMNEFTIGPYSLMKYIALN